MIDSIIVSPFVHLMTGSIVLIANLIFLLVVGRLAWQKRALTTAGTLTFIAFQATLMLQALVGIKLLDQGFGVLQLYIHYLGGLAPLAFCLLFYWLPTTDEHVRSRRLAWVAATSFGFVLLTFAVGSTYSAGIEASNNATSAQTTDTQNLVGDPVRGKTLYEAYGAGAHGVNGEGVAGLGVALNTSDFVAAHSDEELVAFLKAGRDPSAPDNQSGVLMPPNGGIHDATDQDLLDVVAYLRTLQAQSQ